MTLLRPLVADDHATVCAVVDAWWGGRAVRHLLPRLFFEHFSDTSFALVGGSSIAFHRRTGFDLVDTGACRNGVPVSLDHGGAGEHQAESCPALLRFAAGEPRLMW